MSKNKTAATLGVAQGAGLVLVSADHPENILVTDAPVVSPPNTSDLIAQTAAGFNVDKDTATVLVGLGGQFWAALIRHAHDPIKYPLRQRAPRPKKGAIANG